MRLENLFKIYVEYATACRNSTLGRSRPLLSENEFSRVWDSISSSEKSRWESRFNLGYQAIVESEAIQYDKVLVKPSQSKAA